MVRMLPRMLRIVAASLFLLASLACAFISSNATDPYLLPVPAYAFLALVAFALLVSWLVWRRKPRRIFHWACLIAWLAVPVAYAWSMALLEVERRHVLAASEEERALLGPHFITGYRRAEDVAALAQQGLVGGLFITRHNFQGASADRLRDEIAGMQRSRKAAGLPQLIVSADQEGGIVSHLAPPLTRFPSLAALAALPGEARAAAAQRQGEAQGKELAALGITLDFAPVVDLQRPKTEAARDLTSRLSSSHIKDRAISTDPEVTGAIALAFAQGLESAGVGATVKHFPGLGRVDEDTHHFRARLDAGVAELEASDWRPFRALLDERQAALMVGHVVLTAIDPDRPASHSKAVIQGLLRDRWGHQGLIITDDMVMSPVYRHGFCTAVVEALNAGVDLVLIAYDGRQYYKAMDCALTALHHGELDRAMLEASAQRLSAYNKSVSR